MLFHLSRILTLLFALRLIGARPHTSLSPHTSSIDSPKSAGQIIDEYYPTVPSIIETGGSLPSRLQEPSATRLAKRRINTQNLPGGWLLRYHVFRSFASTPFLNAILSDFWTSLALQAITTPGAQFNTPSIMYSIGDLRMVILNPLGTVPRDTVIGIAHAMLVYTGRGFCGFFNAKLTAPGQELWVSFSVKRANI